MLFNSLHYLIFYLAFIFLYYSFNYKNRIALLLLASCYFYMAFVPIYIFIILFTVVIDYFAAILIENETGKKRKLYLIISIVSNILILVLFKYYRFIFENITFLTETFKLSNPLPIFEILLPIGLSFHTFQAISYTIEVYRGNQAAERKFSIYALYVLFFPQMVAGPIERPQNIIHQFKIHHKFSGEKFREGFAQILLGLVKKVIIADRLSMYVDYSYSNFSELSGLTLIIAMVFYSFQIYCDFSGYSDIAIGSAKIMGIDLMKNFNSPYLSMSLSEFWNKWHISLSTWFRDYLYFPMGGSKSSKYRTYYNLMFVFLISGLWHGGSWTFVIWGMIHGLILVIEKSTQKLKILKLLTSSFLLRIIRIIVTFLIVSIAWIFFRSIDLNSALVFINKIIHFSLNDKITSVLNYSEIVFSFILIVLLLIYEKYQYNIKIVKSNFQYLLSTLLIISFIYLFGVFSRTQFIYFQF
jgi:alginate O-acetyltransferase complex protein AlgI